ncbi:MAG TPA: ABC transporter permease [Candidatus Thermoplasmatota archaeon]|nr:ABC transporter permease [Candidatus Thermoplasmatota archaeon]
MTGATFAARLAWPVEDAVAMTRRNLLHYVRVPQLIVYTVIQPIMFTLLFAFVFGGAIATPNGNYVNFLIPGIIVQTVVFGAMGTGIKLAEDMQKGIMDRFRSLPISRSTVLAGRVMTDTIWNTLAILIMAGVGYAIGFRFQGSLLDAFMAVGLGALFAFAFSWIAASIGMFAKTVQSAEMLGFTWVFPLVFVSSVFVPVQTMPDWLEGFAANNPITLAANAVRALALGTPIGNDGLLTVAWCLGIIAVFAPLAVLKFRRLG